MKKFKKIKATVFHYLGLLLVSTFVMLPYYWMIITSIKPKEEVMLSPPTLIPSAVDFSNYIQVWKTLPLAKYLFNSLFVSSMTTIIGVVFAVLCGYSLSRYAYKKLQKGATILMLCTQLIPSVLPMISLYFVMYKLNLGNTYIGLIIAYSVWAIPFCTLMMKSYFTTTIPHELEESATIDGCTKMGTFIRICLPISIPGVVATSIFAFILAWNDYMWASIMLSNNDLKPVSVGIYDYVGQFGGNANLALTMTTAVIVTIPAIILFAFLQKYLISGLSAGAVKG